jgi:hypothetical protein
MKSYPFSQPLKTGIQVVLLLAILLLNFGSSGTGVAYAAPPAHDDFDSAETINSLIYAHEVDTSEATPTLATPVPDDPDNIPCQNRVLNYGFASVWYKYTPPVVQSISLDTIDSNYDTFIAVWTGTRGSLTLIGCGDETSEGFSEMSFIGQAGQTYYIEVAQYNDGLNSTTFFGGDLRFHAYITNTDVKIGNVLRGRYYIPESGGLRRSFISLNSGPVEIYNVANSPIIAAERVIYNINNAPTSFSEMMGLPHNLLSTTYWLPWYNNVDLDTQLRIGNVSGATANITITIGGAAVTGGSFSLGVGQSTRVSFAGINNGPVKIVSSQNIVAAERVIYKVNNVQTSFSEMMALPNSQLNTTYWMPWYNNVDLDTQLRIGNVSGATANITITIGGAAVTGGSFQLGAGQSTRVSFAGINNGPVKIVSSQNIVAAERVIYKINNVPVSFSEMMGLPNSQLNTTYWMPWYNNVNLDTQLRIGNVSTQPATVTIRIGGVQMGGTINLGVGQSTRVSFIGVDDGPVQITSTETIVAAERVIYNVNNVQTSFSEMMGMPNHLLSARYWMPWYNNLDLDTQLRFALP